MTRFNKIKFIPLLPLMVIFFISVLALILLYSVGAGNFFPWCYKQFFRLIIGFSTLFLIVTVRSSFWKKQAYIFYFLCLFLLFLVSVLGKVSMGAQRWLDFYFFNFQPSELMRIFLVMALAKFFSTITTSDSKKTYAILPAIFLTGAPILLVLLQPDLGTAMILLFIFLTILFVNGIQVWKFVFSFIIAACCAPVFWSFLHDYQKDRVLMFLSPERDPSGSGYHIIQSQIALGSGGFWGKGFLNGTQSQLNFLPEKQTDFIFAVLGEEFGFIGCLILLFLYAILIFYDVSVALRAHGKFNQILVMGLTSMLFFYVVINTAMVCGLLPVVGVPLPFFSYGGSALIVLMICQGIIFSIDIEQKNSRRRFH